ncbi:MAG: heavy metal translocating P-type ATPase metal-binding domain-containing protein [Polyangiaceae bacterium]
MLLKAPFMSISAPIPRVSVPGLSTSAERTDCAHCGQPLGAGRVGEFCCTGCQAARSLLQTCNLERYYELRDGVGAPVDHRTKAQSEPWLDEIIASLEARKGETVPVLLDIQGLHCAACVWLLERLFERRGGSSILVNPGVGSMRMLVPAGSFDLLGYVQDVRSLGYGLGPHAKQEKPSGNRGLILRLGISIALAMNVMLFSLPLYFGLVEGPVFQMMRLVAWGLTTTAVLVGGSVFFQSAWRSLRLGLAHLDQPIALGIALAYSGSTYSLFFQNGRAAYLDTVTVFTTLMLLGRFLQERAIESNRRGLLADDGIDQLDARVVVDGNPKVVKFGEVKEGDTLLLLPGELCPVDAEVLEARGAATISREWITGESRHDQVTAGQQIPAGATLVSGRALLMNATCDFAQGRLSALLGSRADANEGPSDVARATKWWRALTRYYVAGVLSVATLGGSAWLLAGAGGQRAIEVTVAILVVTCPCAFGIATPLAYEIVQTRLRKRGTWIRSARLLDRAVDVHKVVLDKTGTLTLGELQVDEAPVLALGDRDQHALWNMVARSTHPKSAVLRKILAVSALSFDANADVEEVPGRGLELRDEASVYRLGSRSWTGVSSEQAGDLFFTRNGEQLFALTTREVARADAPGAVQTLRSRGYELHLLSGDNEARVIDLAKELAIETSKAKASATPEDKAHYLESIDANDTLMVGDGINDAGAIRRAWCSATPAAELPFLPSRADVSVHGPLMSGVVDLLTSANGLRKVVRRTLSVTTAYNVITVGLSVAGLMSPLLCAAVMPLSSLSVVAYVIWALRER